MPWMLGTCTLITIIAKIISLIIKDPLQHFLRTLATNPWDSRTPEHHHIFVWLSRAYIKHIFSGYHLHSLHGQFYGHYFLNSDLQALKVVTSFNLTGTMSHVLRPKNDSLSVPLYTLLQ